jgi:hypothetical protein
MMLLPIIQSAKGTDKIIGQKNSVAGCIMAPWPKSSNISLLKYFKCKRQLQCHHDLIQKVLAFPDLAPSALDKTDPPPTPIAILKMKLRM